MDGPEPIPESEITSLLAAEKLLEDIESRGTMDREEIASLRAALARRQAAVAGQASAASVGWYSRLLGKRRFSLAAAVVLMVVGAGTAGGVTWLWNTLSTEGRFILLACPTLLMFLAARYARRQRRPVLGNVLDVVALLAGCANFAACGPLPVRLPVLSGALVTFAVVAGISCKALLNGPWFALALMTWLLAAGQTVLQVLEPGHGYWIATAGAVLVNLAVWRPWLMMPLKQNRTREAAVSLAAAGGAMLLLGLHVFLRTGTEIDPTGRGLFGPTVLLLSLACLSVAWSGNGQAFSVTEESLRLGCRLLGLLLGAGGVLLSFVNASALAASAGMLALIGPIVWRAGFQRAWPGAVSATAFVVLLSSLWYRLGVGDSADFVGWASGEPAAGLPLGFGGLALLSFAHLARRRRPEQQLLQSPGYLLGIVFVTLGVIQCGQAPEWNAYTSFGFAGGVLVAGYLAKLDAVIYVAFFLGMYGAWQEGIEAAALMHAAPATAGSAGLVAYATTLSLLATLSLIQRRRWPGPSWTTPAIRAAWGIACLAVFLLVVTGQADESSAVIGAMAAAVLLIAAVWESRPPLAAAGSIILISTSALAGTQMPGATGMFGHVGFSPGILAVGLGCLAHLVTWRVGKSDRWFFWARGVYVGTMSLFILMAIDAWPAIQSRQYQQIALDLLTATGVAVLGVGFLPAGLAWSMFAALLSCAAFAGAMHWFAPKAATGLLVHATAGLAVVWLSATTIMRAARQRGRKLYFAGQSALAAFDFAAIFAGLICGLVLVWVVCDEVMGRLIDAHIQHMPVQPIGLVDLTVLIGVCIVPLWTTRSGALVTCLYWLLSLTGIWLALMIPQFKEVRDPVTNIARAVPTAWPVVGMILLTVVTTGFVAAQGYLSHRRRVAAWPDRLGDLLAGYPSWPGFRISVGAVSLLIFAVGVWQISSGWTVVAATAVGACLFALAHRHWHHDLAEVAMGQITLAVCATALLAARLFGAEANEFAVRFPVMCNAALFALVAMTFIWHWLPAVWDQQLHDGRAWTTTGRMIPVAGSFGFLVGALAVLVSMSMALWPVTPNTPMPDNTTSRWIFGMAGNGLMLLVLAWAAVQTKRDTLAWLTAYGVLAVLAFAGIRIPMNPQKEWLIQHWPAVIAGLVALFAIAGPLLARTRLTPFVSPISLLAVGPLPVIAIVGMLASDRMRSDMIVSVTTPALLAAGCLVFAVRARSKPGIVLTALLANAALLGLWNAQGRAFDSHYHVYLFAPGLTILGVAYLYRRLQSLPVFDLTRSVGLLLMFGPLGARLFVEVDRSFAILAVFLAVLYTAAILSGIYLRAKPMLCVGIVFGLVELTALAVRFYHSRIWVTWLIALIILAWVTALIALWKLRRDRVRFWWETFRRWEG